MSESESLVRFYDELVSRARQEVVTLEVPENFAVKHLAYAVKLATGGYEYIALFELNGRRHEVKLRITETDIKCEYPRKLPDMIFNRMAAYIAADLIRGFEVRK